LSRGDAFSPVRRMAKGRKEDGEKENQFNESSFLSDIFLSTDCLAFAVVPEVTDVDFDFV
jgi:hypothetical protein